MNLEEMNVALTKRFIESLTMTTALSAMLYFTANAAAEVRTITAIGEYRMGDNDTRTDAKRLALLDAKRVALEKAGVYIESITEVKNFDLTREEIRAYTGGIVEVIEQKTRTVMEGDSTVVRVEVATKIDTNLVTRQIDAFRHDEGGRKEILRLRMETEQLRKEVDAATRELASLKAKTQVETATARRQQLINRVLANELVDRAIAAYSEFVLAWANPGGTKSDFSLSALEALSRMRHLTEEALSLDPSNLEAKRLKVRVLQHEGAYLADQNRHDDAISKFQEAVRLRPNDASVHAHFSRTLIRMGKPDAALAEARTAISLEPEVAMHYVSLGHVFQSERDFESAAAAFRKAVSLDANNGHAHVGLGLALSSGGNTQEADQEFKRGMRLLLGE